MLLTTVTACHNCTRDVDGKADSDADGDGGGGGGGGDDEEDDEHACDDNDGELVTRVTTKG